MENIGKAATRFRRHGRTELLAGIKRTHASPPAAAGSPDSQSPERTKILAGVKRTCTQHSPSIPGTSTIDTCVKPSQCPLGSAGIGWNQTDSCTTLAKHTWYYQLDTYDVKPSQCPLGSAGIGSNLTDLCTTLAKLKYTRYAMLSKCPLAQAH